MSIVRIVLWERGDLVTTPERKTLRDVYRVFTDDVANDRDYIDQNMSSGAGPGPATVPIYYTAHPVYATLGLLEQSISQVDRNPYAWEVSCDYSSRQEDFESGGNSSDTPLGAFYENPLDTPPDLRLGSVNLTRSFEYDLNGQLVGTIAGEPFDPPFEHDEKNTLFTVSRIETGFSDTKRRTYINKVNSGSFGGRPRGSVLMRDITAEAKWVKNTLYWKVNYEMEYAPTHRIPFPALIANAAPGPDADYWSWDLYAPNVGFKMINDTTGQLEDIWLDWSADGAPIPFSDADKDGDQADAPTNSPWRLDVDGLPITDPEASTFYMWFRRFEAVDFSALNLPGDVP